MVDRQSKDSYYQQQLAQAAWAGFSRTGYPGYPGASGATPSMAGHAPSTAAHYENYMQQLQQLASAQAAQSAAAADRQSMFGGAANPNASYGTPFAFPPGHPMHFPGISNYHRPLPAHNPLPAHMKNNPASSTSTLPTQLPAHMRSNPYQQTTNYHNLNSAYAAYGMAGQGGASSYTQAQEQEKSRQEQERSRQLQGRGAQSQSAPQSRASSQDPAQKTTGLPNGGPSTSEVSSAYTQLQQLQQLQSAYNQATTGMAARESATKDAAKAKHTAASNGGYPYPGYQQPSTTNPPTAGSPFSGSNPSMGNNYDEIAATLLNRFGPQFSPQLLMEMTKGYNQMSGFSQSLATSQQQAGKQEAGKSGAPSSRREDSQAKTAEAAAAQFQKSQLEAYRNSSANQEKPAKEQHEILQALLHQHAQQSKEQQSKDSTKESTRNQNLPSGFNPNLFKAGSHPSVDTDKPKAQGSVGGGAKSESKSKPANSLPQVGIPGHPAGIPPGAYGAWAGFLNQGMAGSPLVSTQGTNSTKTVNATKDSQPSVGKPDSQPSTMNKTTLSIDQATNAPLTRPGTGPGLPSGRMISPGPPKTSPVGLSSPAMSTAPSMTSPQCPTDLRMTSPAMGPSSKMTSSSMGPGPKMISPTFGSSGPSPKMPIPGGQGPRMTSPPYGSGSPMTKPTSLSTDTRMSNPQAGFGLQMISPPIQMISPPISSGSLPSPGQNDARMAVPGHSDVRMAGPGHSDAGVIGPGHSGSRMTGPGHSNVRMTGPGHSDLRMTGPSHSDLRMMGPGHSDPRLMGPGNSGPRMMGSGSGDPRMMGPGYSATRMTIPRHNDPRMMGPGQSDPRIVGPGHNIRQMGPSRNDMRMTGPTHGEVRITGPTHGEVRITGPTHGEVRITGPTHGEMRMTGPGQNDARMPGSGHTDSRMMGPELSDVRITGSGHNDTRMIGSGSSDARMTLQGNIDVRMTGLGNNDARMAGSENSDMRMKGMPPPSDPQISPQLTSPQCGSNDAKINSSPVALNLNNIRSPPLDGLRMVSPPGQSPYPRPSGPPHMTSPHGQMSPSMTGIQGPVPPQMTSPRSFASSHDQLQISTRMTSPQGPMPAHMTSPPGQMSPCITNPLGHMHPHMTSPHGQMSPRMTSPQCSMTSTHVSPQMSSHGQVSPQITSPHGHKISHMSSPHDKNSLMDKNSHMSSPQDKNSHMSCPPEKPPNMSSSSEKNSHISGPLEQKPKLNSSPEKNPNMSSSPEKNPQMISPPMSSHPEHITSSPDQSPPYTQPYPSLTTPASYSRPTTPTPPPASISSVVLATRKAAESPRLDTPPGLAGNHRLDTPPGIGVHLPIQLSVHPLSQPSKELPSQPSNQPSSQPSIHAQIQPSHQSSIRQPSYAPIATQREPPTPPHKASYAPIATQREPHTPPQSSIRKPSYAPIATQREPPTPPPNFSETTPASQPFYNAEDAGGRHSLPIPTLPSKRGSSIPSPTPPKTSIPPSPRPTSSIPPSPRPTSSIPPSPRHTSSIPPSPRHTSSIPPSPRHTSSIPPSPRHTSSIPPSPHHISSIPPSPHHTSSIPPSPRHTSSIPPSPRHTLSIPPSPRHTASIPPSPRHTSSIPPSPRPISPPTSQPNLTPSSLSIVPPHALIPPHFSHALAHSVASQLSIPSLHSVSGMPFGLAGLASMTNKLKESEYARAGKPPKKSNRDPGPLKGLYKMQQELKGGRPFSATTSSYAPPASNAPSTSLPGSPRLPPIPILPMSETRNSPKSMDVPPHSAPNRDRMEIKNSGIPGPGAVTWKRKSLEDSPVMQGKAKKGRFETKVMPSYSNAHEDFDDDPYAFDDDRESENYGKSGKGPVYKYKNALLSREPEISPGRVGHRETDYNVGKSRESQLSPARLPCFSPARLPCWSPARLPCFSPARIPCFSPARMVSREAELESSPEYIPGKSRESQLSPIRIRETQLGSEKPRESQLSLGLFGESQPSPSTSRESQPSPSRSRDSQPSPDLSPGRLVLQEQEPELTPEPVKVTPPASLPLDCDNSVSNNKPVFSSKESSASSDDNSRSSVGHISQSKKLKVKRPKHDDWIVAEPSNKSVDPEKMRDKKDEKKENLGRKGPLWGLPKAAESILPKPQKTVEKPPPRDKSSSVSESRAKDAKVSVNDVWLQAFGGVKPKKRPLDRETPPKKIAKVEREEKTVQSILHIPPEMRRKPRPDFGGLIHFSPDWVRSVRRHHERCKIPTQLDSSGKLKPKILAGQSTPKKNYEDFARKNMVSPPDIHALERERAEVFSRAIEMESEKCEDASVSVALPSIVDAILENRKKLRANPKMGRMYKLPLERLDKEKKKVLHRARMEEMKRRDGNIGMLPTPGLPLLTQDTRDVLMGSNFGNFRRQTLLRYFDRLGEAGDLKAQLLDWHPEVLESKTRRQTSLTKAVTSVKEIFGLELPGKGSVKTSSNSAKASATSSIVKERTSAVKERTSAAKERTSAAKERTSAAKERASAAKERTSAVKERTSAGKDRTSAGKERTSVGKEKKENTGVDTVPKVEEKEKPVKKERAKREPKSQPMQPVDEGEEVSCYSQEIGEPTEQDNLLQAELGTFALDLLDDNPSWSRRVTIQNLVIFETIEPALVKKKKGGKKKRSRKSGLDFTSRSKKSKSSRDVSRAGSPSPPEEVHEIEYSINNVVAESNRWVVDKNAGETILHRAAKMGYPDVVAYAVDMLGVSVMEKDYAGLTPLHKASYKGHDPIVRVLLKYGADPSSGVKGTRALHEAIEGISRDCVYTLLTYGADPLLHDYSGNMPIDLADNDHDMKHYLYNILADLAGNPPKVRGTLPENAKPASRWNVSHRPDFHQPPESSVVSGRVSDNNDNLLFEVTSHLTPNYFQFRDREGAFVLYRDLKEYVRKYCHKTDIRAKGDLLELCKSEFFKQSHCAMLDRRNLTIKTEKDDKDSKKEETVLLVKVDKFVKKLLNVESIPVPS